MVVQYEKKMHLLRIEPSIPSKPNRRNDQLHYVSFGPPLHTVIIMLGSSTSGFFIPESLGRDPPCLRTPTFPPVPGAPLRKKSPVTVLASSANIQRSKVNLAAPGPSQPEQH